MQNEEAPHVRPPESPADPVNPDTDREDFESAVKQLRGDTPDVRYWLTRGGEAYDSPGLRLAWDIWRTPRKGVAPAPAPVVATCQCVPALATGEYMGDRAPRTNPAVVPWGSLADQVLVPSRGILPTQAETLPASGELVDFPPLESQWLHTNGNTYTVSQHANVHSTRPEYPPGVVYHDQEGTVYFKPLATWYRNRTRVA